MDRLGRVGLILGALTALPTGAGCGGELIHLSNGSAGPDGGACSHGQVPASQVLWTGDSWQLVPAGAEAHTDVRNLARVAGAIGPSDDYTIGAVAAAPMIPPATKGGPTPVPTQYTSQQATAPVKVLIMDGGTWDTITNNSSATVTSVANNFTQLLSTVASDGTVTHVIYFLMPSSIPGVTELRPLLQQSCGASTVPCHFIDLQQLWTDPTAYATSGNPPVPTAAGASVIANAIWSTMQTYCIAQ